MVNSVRCSAPIGVRRKYNPYVSKQKSMNYHILNKISMNKYVARKNSYVKNSFVDDLVANLFAISEEVEKDYNIYKLRKKNGRKHAIKFSFYNNDGSFSVIGILLGMCCDDESIRQKASRIFFINMESIMESEEFKDVFTLAFSSSVFLYLYFLLFFNFTEFVNHLF